MPGPVSLHFTSAPALLPAYLKILLARKPAVAAEAPPRIEAMLERFTIDSEHLARYRRVCGERECPELPIAYPHVLATPVHLAMVANDAFPVSLMGVVHIRNRIVQHRPLRVDDAGGIRTWLEGHRESPRGQEFDLQTEVQVGPETVWAETCTFLARRRGGSRSSRERTAPVASVTTPPRQDVSTSSFIVEPDVGRRYARVSGDFNPIHIADLAARIFGFKRAIAHGMWSLARCVAELGPKRFSAPCALDVAFKLPITFCAKIVLESWMAGGAVGFSLRDSRGDRGHLLGSVVPST